jgi:hypothetical protein
MFSEFANAQQEPMTLLDPTQNRRLTCHRVQIVSVNLAHQSASTVHRLQNAQPVRYQPIWPYNQNKSQAKSRHVRLCVLVPNI